jgi:hypothetical protein
MGSNMSGYRIKDWEKFQHYKTGAHADKPPEWIKLYPKLLNDIEFHKLNGDDAKTLMMLWMLASENGGTLPSFEKIAFRLRLSEKQIKSVLSRLPHWVESPSRDCLEPVYTTSSPEEEENKNKKERENGASAPSPKKGSQVPEGWEPSLETLENLKVKKGFPPAIIASELEKFRDFHQAKGSVFKDFEAAFRTWMTKSREFATANGHGKVVVPLAKGPWKPLAPVESDPIKPSLGERERQVQHLLKARRM